MNKKTGLGATILAATLLAGTLLACAAADAQDGHEPDPASALSAALAAACRANATDFANYLTADNAPAFQELPAPQRTEFMKRFATANAPGKPLLSNDPQNHIVLNCETPSETITFRFGDVRLHENLAFIPVTVVGAQKVQFGLVREGGSWRVISLGLVLLDIPELSKQWANEDMTSREDAIVTALEGLTEAIQRYQRAFGKLPGSLAELGPAPAGQISPEEASLVDKDLAAGAAGGYHFGYRVVSTADPNAPTFELTATPDGYGKTGRRSFFVDGAGRIHAADKGGAAATGDDPVLDAEKTQ
ncbi:MAG TPA: hypothetical protein VLY23_04830 [Candidatus Acidoferrum sp.]|nr:hypothetical protein [Candidatus Acidoferrum sp.]